MNEKPMEVQNCYPLRPGGSALTLQLSGRSGLPEGSVIVDVGCGFGDSVRLLQALGYEAYGLDIDEERLAAARRQDPSLADRFFLRDAAKLLDENGRFFLASSHGIHPDAFLFECSFTKLEQPELTARQAYSVLPPGGLVMLSDVVCEDGDASSKCNFSDGSCLLGRLIPAQEIISCFTDAGFALEGRQEYPQLLRTYAGNLILNFGAEEAERCLGMSLKQLKTASLSYETMLFRK